MNLRSGTKIWIPCEVKPGPFSNERLVRVELPSGQWTGFVEVGALKDPIEEGETAVLGTVVTVENNMVSLRFPGRSLTSGESRGQVSQVPLGALEA
jgi:hypothetical protein